jgi:hypothetical protein
VAVKASWLMGGGSACRNPKTIEPVEQRRYDDGTKWS